jgi:hypothetical protein
MNREIEVFNGKEIVQQEITICDFPMGSTLSISEDAWREIPKSRSSANRESAYRGFQGHETLTLRNRDMRNPDTIMSR